MKLLKILPLLFFVIVFSCKKDDEAPSKTALLTAKGWQITKFEENGVDATSDYQEECDKDDVYTFTAAGAVSSTVGSVKCTEDEVGDTGTWSFKESETKFSIQFTGEDAEEYKLVSLTSTTFKISSTDGDITLTITLTAK